MAISALSSWWGCLAESLNQRCKQRGLFHNPERQMLSWNSSIQKEIFFVKLYVIKDCKGLAYPDRIHTGFIVPKHTIHRLPFDFDFWVQGLHNKIGQMNYMSAILIHTTHSIYCKTRSLIFWGQYQETFWLLMWSLSAWMLSILVACRASCFFRVASIQSVREALVSL